MLQMEAEVLCFLDSNNKLANIAEFKKYFCKCRFISKKFYSEEYKKNRHKSPFQGWGQQQIFSMPYIVSSLATS
jgi:hypothetical protein